MIQPNEEMQEFLIIFPGLQPQWDSMDDTAKAWLNEFMKLPTELRIATITQCALIQYGQVQGELPN